MTKPLTTDHKIGKTSKLPVTKSVIKTTTRTIKHADGSVTRITHTPGR